MADGGGELHRLGALLDVVQRVNEAGDLECFVSRLLDGLVQLIPCDLVTYNEVDPRGTHFVSVARPADFEYPPDIYDRFAKYRPQHPVLEHQARTGEGTAMRISDFLTNEDYRATDLYREVYGPMGVEHQIVFRLPCPSPLVVVVAMARQDRDFTDEECRLLELLRPHVTATFRHLRRAELLSRQLEMVAGSGPGTTRAVVRRRADGGLEADDEDGARLLARLVVPGATLGKALEDWLAAPPTADFPATLRLTAATGTVLIRAETADDGTRTLVLEEQVVDDVALRELGLTARQAEVLARIVEGGTNASIASALGIRPATVKKLLEQVYAKLGVHDRRSAIAAALEVLPEPEPGPEAPTA